MRDFRDDLDDLELLDAATDDPARAEKVAAALDLLEHGPGAEERVLAIQRLGKLRAEHGRVRAASHSKNRRIRASAAEALGHFADESDRTHLEQLTADPEHAVRAAACRGLGFGRFVDSLLLLLDIAEDVGEDRIVRKSAIRAAARVAACIESAADDTGDSQQGDVLVAATVLVDRGVINYSDYFNTLGELSCEASHSILVGHLQQMELEGADQTTARALLRALAKVPNPDDQILNLVAAALDALPGARTEAARILERHPFEPARHALEGVLVDANPSLVAAAAKALCRLGLGPSLAMVEPLLRSDSQTTLRLIAALEGPEAVTALERVVREGPTGIRAAALQSLARSDKHKGRVLAEQMTADPNPRLRLAAYGFLSEVDDSGFDWHARWAADPVAWVAAQALATRSDDAR